jgi:hypothetical protein
LVVREDKLREKCWLQSQVSEIYELRPQPHRLQSKNKLQRVIQLLDDLPPDSDGGKNKKLNIPSRTVCTGEQLDQLKIPQYHESFKAISEESQAFSSELSSPKRQMSIESEFYRN